MSYWSGFAQAFKDADAKKTRSKELSDQREYDSSVREESRAFQRQMFEDQLAAQRADAAAAIAGRKDLADYQYQLETKGKLLGSLSGGRTPSSGGGGSKTTENPAILLKKFAKEFPDLEAERLATLARNPTALATLYKSIKDKQEEYRDSGLGFGPTEVEQMFTDVITTYRDPDSITEDEVYSVVDSYGLSREILDDPVNEGSGMTFEDVIRNDLSQGTTDFIGGIVPEPISPRDLQSYEDIIQERLLGDAEANLLKSQDLIGEMTSAGRYSSEEIQAEVDNGIIAKKIVEQIEAGNIQPQTINNSIGTKILVDMMARDNRFDPWQIYTFFVPHFDTEEEAEAAYNAGMYKTGRKFRVGVDAWAYGEDGIEEEK